MNQLFNQKHKDIQFTGCKTEKGRESSGLFYLYARKITWRFDWESCSTCQLITDHVKQHSCDDKARMNKKQQSFQKI